ncbi:SH3 domain-containing protein [Candidatus Electronema sp. JC]|uniref:SH3 domain-containing protein n=1 Tax=Candidatus Electronema sp. JC TaxID=3401570 RepID=UPI003B43C15C
MNYPTCAARTGLLLASLLLASSVSAAEFVSVIKDGVNVRSGPSLEAAVLFQAPGGYPLEVVGRQGEWLNVSDFENETGWIAASLVAETPYVIAKRKGNIREGAGIEHRQIGSVVREVILKKVEQQGEWIKISHPQLPSGWIYQDLVWP